jgi:hypothetical protein
MLFSGPGWLWLLGGATVTLIPLLTIAFLGRLVLKTKFANLYGMLAGSMTDPPSASLRDRFHLLRGTAGRLCDRLSTHHDSQGVRRAGSGFCVDGKCLRQAALVSIKSRR